MYTHTHTYSIYTCICRERTEFLMVRTHTHFLSPAHGHLKFSCLFCGNAMLTLSIYQNSKHTQNVGLKIHGSKRGMSPLWLMVDISNEAS